MMNKKINILVIRFSSMGDIALVSPVLALIHRLYGKRAHVSFITRKEFKPLLENHPFIDDLISYEKKSGLKDIKQLFKVCREIRQKAAPDMIYDLHGNQRSFFIRNYFVRTPFFRFDKRKLERQILIMTKKDFFKKEVDPWQRYQEKQGELFVKRVNRDILALGLSEKGLGEEAREQFIDEIPFKTIRSRKGQFAVMKAPLKMGEQVSTFVQQMSGKSSVVLLPGAAHKTKQWNVEFFMALAENILNDLRGVDQVIVLAGPGDEFCRSFDKLESDYPERFFNLQGKLNLGDSLHIIERTDFCVGNDTGMSHISEALGTPVLILQGPTSPSWGYVPHLPLSSYVWNQTPCNPCSPNGSKECTVSGRPCLDLLLPQQVFQTLREKWKKLA